MINSAIDSWQLVNVWRRFARCRWEGQRNCSDAATRDDVRATNAMITSFADDVRAELGPTGHGAHINTCNEHVAGLAYDAYRYYEVKGVSMRDALATWWKAPAREPTARHLRLLCQLTLPVSSAGGDAPQRPQWAQHHQCNPSCSAARRRRRLSQECPCDPP